MLEPAMPPSALTGGNKRPLPQPSSSAATDSGPLAKRRQPLTSSQQQKPAYTQADLLVMALEQNPPHHCLPRKELIRAAVDLDTRLNQDMGRPRAFRGKTPMNSASAVLSYNADGYFTRFKPNGSKSTYFRLSQTPDNFQRMVEHYQRWQANLFHNWLDPPQQSLEGQTEFDVFLARRRWQKDAVPPQSWQDLLHMADPQGQGPVSAARDLPAKTTLGFYFGVPMTLHDFCARKQDLGDASRYCIALDETHVLDATDAQGRLFDSVIACPFHYVRRTTDVAACNVTFSPGSEENQVVCRTLREIPKGEELVCQRFEIKRC